MLLRNHRAIAALSPLHALRLCQSPVLAARFQREASYHTLLPRLSQLEVESRPRVAVRTLHVTFGACKNVINHSKSTRCNIHTGDPTRVTKPTSLSDQKYHETADLYFEAILDEVEELQNNGSDIIAEYSAGILTINAPDVGSYIINKQPSNRQIWLSSPISGQRYYDWVLQGGGRLCETQDTKDEIYFGEWLYLKDGSNMSTLLNAELGLRMEMLFA